MSDLSWLNPTPHAIAVYASRPLSPVATQHSLPSGRYSLLGPDFHRLDRASFAWRTHSITSSARASSVAAATVEAERLGRLQVDQQLVFGRCLHRQVGGLLALEDAIDIAGRAAILVDQVRPVGDEASGCDGVAAGIDCGQTVPGRQCDDQLAMNDRRLRFPSRSGRHSPPLANAATARSISPGSRASTGVTCRPNAGTTICTAPNCPIPEATAGSRSTAARASRRARPP